MFDRWLINNFGIASDLLFIDQKTLDFRLVNTDEQELLPI